MGNGVKVLDQDGEVIAEFYAIKRKDNRLIVDGKALGVMRMDMILTPAELLKGFKMALSWGVLSYILLVPYFTAREVFRRCFGGSRKVAGEKKPESQ
ncbi:MAG TPA: hypothetical protein VN415_05770 [Dehalococcoidia bacterium]|nr:hypothetical protein [Dehalococcoidia bacterium]